MTGNTMGKSEWALLLILSALWGGSFFFVEIALADLPPFTLVWLRVAIAAAVLSTLLKLIGVKLSRSPSVWGAFAMMALLNNALPFSLLTWGQTEIASGLAAILNATTPLFTLLIAHFLTRDEKISANKIAGIVLGFAGVIAMIGGEALTGIGNQWIAQCACLAAALSYAFASVYGRRFQSMGIAPLATASGQLICSTMLLLPLMLIVDTPWQLAAPAPQSWLAIAALALFSTALAYILYFRILAKAGATNLLLVTFLIPVTAIGLGIFVLHEELTPQQIGGMALIGMGLIMIDGRLLRMWRGSAATPS